MSSRTVIIPAATTSSVAAINAGDSERQLNALLSTTAACRKMIDGAQRAGIVLSVSENYRRDPRPAALP